MLWETSIFTLPGKVPLWQKCQNDVSCGNINKDVFPYILKFKFFLKTTCSTMTTWIHVGLLQSKIEMMYLPKQFSLIIIHRNNTYLCISVISITNKRNHKKNTKVCMFILYMYVDILFPLKKFIPIMFERVITHYQTL